MTAVPRSSSARRLIELVEAFSRLRVAIVGDVIADEFIYGRIARVSREAPVLILDYDSTEILPGGAGNAASNVAALGAHARAVGVVGRDEPGRRLVAALAARGVDVRKVAASGANATATKTRILAGGIHSAKQQVVRIDRASGSDAVSAPVRAAVAARARAAVRGADALIVSDYGGGIATPALAMDARACMARGSRGARPPLVMIDSRYDLLRFRGMTACTPNEAEVEQALGVRIGENRRVLERAGRELLARTRARAVLITRGSRGMALFERDRPIVHLPIVGSDQIADVTGAGDTVIATMTLALAAGGSFEDAARLANCAGGIVVMKRGTATVSADELCRAIAEAP